MYSYVSLPKGITRSHFFVSLRVPRHVARSQRAALAKGVAVGCHGHKHPLSQASSWKNHGGFPESHHWYMKNPGKSMDFMETYWKILDWFPFMNDFPRKNYSYPFIDGTFPQLTVNWGSSKLWLFHVKHFLVFLGEAWFTSYVVLVCTDTIIPGVLSQQIIITITITIIIIIIIIELEDAAIRGTELSDLPWF